MKIAIVCGAPSSEYLAPFFDPEWEIWVLGNRLQRFDGRRVTRVFEIHDNLTEHGNPKQYATWLISKKLPLITSDRFPIEDNEFITKYPYDSVKNLYGELYLTSSPAYMIAYAILIGATDIGLYGVDLSISDHEYFWQRPCVEAWIGFAKGRGINIIIPDVSHIGKSRYIEGRDWNGETEVGVFSQESFGDLSAKHHDEITKIKQQQHELALKAAMHDGAVQVYERLAKVARAVEAKVDVNSLLETTIIR